MYMLKEENSEAQSQLKVFFLELTDFFSFMYENPRFSNSLYVKRRSHVRERQL